MNIYYFYKQKKIEHYFLSKENFNGCFYKGRWQGKNRGKEREGEGGVGAEGSHPIFKSWFHL